jgi:hypothetical protein
MLSNNGFRSPARSGSGIAINYTTNPGFNSRSEAVNTVIVIFYHLARF